MAADLPTRLGTSTPFPECLAELTEPAALGVATDYLARLTRDAPPDVLRVCDKMLSHVLLLGLVAASFPRATIIHCRRQLMDVGLSMYMHSFSGSGVGYAYDLDDIGRYHQACERLMAHFKRVCPLEIVDLEYEELVASPEAQTRELVHAVGLEWDPRCLDFHLADRPVHTVSDWQVREPVHTRSVARFRRYEEHLAPLRKYL